MARYRKVDPRIWNDAKFSSLTDAGKLVFFFLLTHPNMTALGAMRHSIPGMAAELQWELEAFRKAFLEACSKGMAKHDEKASFVWLPNFLKYNRPESPNVVKSWADSLELLPECGLVVELIQHVNCLLKDMPKAFAEALPKTFRKTMPNQEQEQEQEQDLREPPSDEGGLSASPPSGGLTDTPVQIEPETGQGQAREDSAPKRARVDDCPHREIIELFHETLPELPRVESWAADNQAQLKSRWREDGTRQSLAWWGAFFQRVKASDFLCGQVAGREGRPFFATLSWLVKRANLGKVLNGQYDNRGPRTGSSLGNRNAMAAQMAIANRRQHAGS
ncbi:hypothetical protein [Solidesulfovibrio sp.]|uniref:hypothetical protein n=1 Tax=Solidesulfovibrio sp. TaxID=2910990 RepID=UPI002626046E|nr:hypothetical protein [Solidesulfovibrio sp.]